MLDHHLWKVGKKFLIIKASADLSKSFDTLNHEMLIPKFSAHCLTNEVLKLIESYHTDVYYTDSYQMARSLVVKGRSLVVSDLHSETKGSRFKPGF